MSENVNEENGTSYMMKESTKYDLAVSDQTSVFSRKINQNKPGYEESIDLTCLEISDLSCKIDLCPQNNKEGDQTLSEIFSYFSIPEITSNFTIELYGYNIGENSRLRIIYPIHIIVNIFSQFEQQNNEFILLKFLNVKCSVIEIEASIDILLEIMNKISTLIDQTMENFKELFS